MAGIDWDPEAQNKFKLAPVPSFASEKEERAWWDKQDLTALEQQGQAQFQTEPLVEPVERTYIRPRGGRRVGAGRKKTRDQKITMKVSSLAIHLLDKLAEREHTSKVAIFEQAIALMAETKGLDQASSK